MFYHNIDSCKLKATLWSKSIIKQESKRITHWDQAPAEGSSVPVAYPSAEPALVLWW